MGSTYHQRNWVKPLEYVYQRDIHQTIHETYFSRFFEVAWDDARKLDKDKFDQTMERTRWKMVSFSTYGLYQVMNLFPTFGLSIWILWNAPLSFFVFVLTIGFSIWYFQKKERDVGKYHDIWEEIWIENENKFTHSIHNEAKGSIERSTNLIGQYENLRAGHGNETKAYVDNITNMFTLVLCIDYYLRSRFDFTPTFMILYTQYTGSVRKQIGSLADMYTS